MRKRKINVLQRQQGRNPFIKNSKKQQLFIVLSIPLVLFLSLIVVIPTVIVLVSDQNKEPDDLLASPREQTVFNELKVETTPIEVSIQRSESNQIETIPLEQYVASVVASEMPATFELDALKAQAIAARTYIVNHLLRDGEEIITDTTNHQVYRNKEELQTIWGADFHWKWEKIIRAAAETENLIITYESEPITPTFFSMSNGYTEDAQHYWGNDLPYLKSVESKWEETLPNFKTQEIFTVTEINKLLNIQLRNGEAAHITMNHTPSKRVSKLQINDYTFTGRDIREKLNLRSTDFTIEQKNNHFIFTTKGYGHGVGMSQYGANGMAMEGKAYDEILSYYYKDIEISEITEGAPSLLATNK